MKKKKLSKREQRKRQKERSKRWRENNPIRYCYNNIKNRARPTQRNRPFTMSYEWFAAWCVESGYMDTKGKKKGSGSIDCIIEELGYAEGNLQILTLEHNTLKQRMKEKGIMWYRGMNDGDMVDAVVDDYQENPEKWEAPYIGIEF